jgi:LPS export ABC transporter protein LptC
MIPVPAGSLIPCAVWRTAALASLLLVAACRGSGTDPMVAEFETLPADQIMEGVEFTSTSAGIRSAKLLSDTAYLFEDSSVMHLRGVDLEMYDATGTKTAHLTSLTGVFNQNTEAMIANEDVVLIVLKDGRRILTDELHYDPQTRRVWSDVETRMTLPDGSDMTVESFTADDQFNNVQTRGARGRSPTTRITF